MTNTNEPMLFEAHGLRAFRMTESHARALQKLLERCHDYFELVDGRRAKGDAALQDLRRPPAGVPKEDLIPIGLFAMNDALVGMILTVRNFRRQRQWYISLQLMDPRWRGRGAGKEIYLAFESWTRSQQADSIMLSVVEANPRAMQFWEKLGFGFPRCYPAQAFGRKRHVLIEYEKTLETESPIGSG